MAEAELPDGVPRAELVELAIGGRVYGGWKTIRIELDLDTGASAFELKVTERWSGQPERWAIEVDSPAQVLIGGETVISGYVDTLSSELSGNDHTISAAGRSRAADLIDCSAVASPGSWRGRRLEQIAAELAKPFGISVTATADTGAPFKLFALQPGETAWEAIQRLCAHRALLAVSTAAGVVEITTPAPIGAAVRIAQGRELLSVSGRHSSIERYSDYIVKGQAAGDDEVSGKAAAAPRAEATDPAVKRHRPLLVIAEDQGDVATLRSRAQWEVTVRAAKAQDAGATVLGWRRGDGQLWRPQQCVDLFAPAAWMDDELMVGGVALILDEAGRRAELRLVRPQAYSRLPVPEEAETSRIVKPARDRRRSAEREAA